VTRPPTPATVDPRELLAEMIALEGATVVDVGCGDGALVRWLAQRGAHAIGVEIGEEPLARALAAPRAADERYEQAGGEALPLPDGAADAATFIQSLHHVPVERMDRALQELARVLRAGGGAFVQEPLPEGPLFEVLQPLDDETAVRHAAQAALARLPAGLAIERSETFDQLVAHASFDALCDRVVTNDASRAARLPAAREEMRARFERLAVPADGGFVLRQPTKVDLLRRA
jgi:ubiquinone/menaquinone biosynthesis C-methylase UbiE